MKKIFLLMFVCASFALNAQYVNRQSPVTIAINGTNVNFTKNGFTRTAAQSDIGVEITDTTVKIFNIWASASPLPFYFGVYDDLVISGKTSVADKKAYVLALPVRSGGGGGGGTATSTAVLQQTAIDSLKSVITQLKALNASTQLNPAFGTTTPTTNSYTASQALITTNALSVIIENTGSANGTITEGGVTFTVPAGLQYIYERVFDHTTNKYTPLPSLSVNGTGTSIKVTMYLKQ